MKNSSEIYLVNIKTDSFTLFPEIWNFFSEFKEIYFDEKFVWRFIAEDKEVTKDCAPEEGEEEDNLLSPSNIF